MKDRLDPKDVAVMVEIALAVWENRYVHHGPVERLNKALARTILELTEPKADAN